MFGRANRIRSGYHTHGIASDVVTVVYAQFAVVSRLLVVVAVLEVAQPVIVVAESIPGPYRGKGV